MEYITLKKPNSLMEWLRVYRLYMTAFPASERKPFGMILRMFRKGVTDVFCVQRMGEFRGIGITINSPDVILLDYFAMEKQHRGEGIGSAALEALLRHYGDKGLFVEIESTALDTPDRAMRQRRKRFYLAAGLEELQVNAKLFGVEMELLGSRCKLDFLQYKAFYRDNYNRWASDHIERSEL